MNLEIFGLITVGTGLALLGAPVFWTLLFMCVSTVFGATAAVNLSAIGSSILVPYLFLMFFITRVYLASGEGPVLAALRPWKPGFWLLVLTIHAVLSAYFLPRIFAGMTDTLTITRSIGSRNVIAQVPLTATSSNLVQAVYTFGCFLCFAFAYSCGQKFVSAKQIATIFLVAGAVNIFFAVADLITYYSNTGYLLDFVRTATYRLFTESEKLGLKRITGTFSEASAFAGYSLVFFAFAASLWLDKAPSRAAGVVALALLILIVFSTSSTGFVGLVVTCSFLGMRSFLSYNKMPEYSRPAFLVLAIFVAILIVLSVPLLFSEFTTQVQNYLDEIVFNKLDSDSGRERTQWNAAAFQTFLDTYGFGAGVGSARASSLAFVLLSNVGVFGTLMFAIFIASLLMEKTGWTVDASRAQLDRARTARALKAGLVAIIAVKMLSQTVYVPGLLLMLVGGLGSAICYGYTSQKGLSKGQKLVSCTTDHWSSTR